MVKPSAPIAAPGPRPPLSVDMLPHALLDTPLEYILADHVRQRSICAALQEFADQAEAPRLEADKVCAFLGHDRLIHHADEDQDLFPILRRRMRPEDNLGPVLDRLSDDHRRSDLIAADIVAALSVTPASDPLPIRPATARAMRRYVADEQRHLAIENGVVMVIAAIRLAPRDLRAISGKMKARRGLAHQA